jgi:hypothetical protein
MENVQMIRIANDFISYMNERFVALVEFSNCGFESFLFGISEISWIIVLRASMLLKIPLVVLQFPNQEEREIVKPKNTRSVDRSIGRSV